MILECDVGNTRCKWRLLGRGETIGSGSLVHGQPYSKLGSLDGVDRIRVASVASHTIKDQFVRSLLPLEVSPEFAVPSSEVAGVRCGYEDYLRLGVDRWLAIVAAFNYTRRATLVLDVGSALTVDVVTINGQHLGGYIVPGSVLMYECLLTNTGQVRFKGDLHEAGLAFGANTEDAVNAGVLSALVGSVLVAIAEARKQLGEDFTILLTGGDAKKLANPLADDFDVQVELMPDLVLDGLALVLP